MTCIPRRHLISAAAVGLATPLLLDESASAAGAAVIRTADVPVGGGVIVEAREVVVTQPKANRFRVFSAVCTHTGCIVNTVSQRRIGCPCHGSQFKITNGAVHTGPAAAPLPARAFTIKRGKIFLT
ncbi:MAG: Rieske (2Fe-2S) protein [Nocardioides sp.]